MEFDTSLKLIPVGSLRVAPGKDYEAYLEDVGALLRSRVANVGEGGVGEFWMDYSTPLQTRHIVVNVENSSEGEYEIALRAGKRPGRLADVIVMGLALLLMWCLGKALVPDPSCWHIAGAGASAAGIAATLVFAYGKTFGNKEAAQLIEKLSK